MKLDPGERFPDLDLPEGAAQLAFDGRDLHAASGRF